MEIWRHVPETGPFRSTAGSEEHDLTVSQALFESLVLGVIEGLTEFLPVSSTAHLLLAKHFFGLDKPATYFVLIQLGAILAIVAVYFARLGTLIRDAMTGKVYAWRFACAVALACLPAVIAGILARDFIQQIIYETPIVICITLLIGGIILLIVDRLPLRQVYTDIYDYPLRLAFIIGLFQMLALIPGVSRSGATVVGAMLFGADKRSAAEFTFMVALPIMAGAFGYDLYKSRDLIDLNLGVDIAVGFVASFIVGLLVVRHLLAFVSKHGFAPFAWWRIIVGGGGLVALIALG